MEDFKEFQEKSLDEAIKSACVYYNAPREKLEIDIVQDAKTGVFGLIGARKAIVRARRVAGPCSLDTLIECENGASSVHDCTRQDNVPRTCAESAPVAPVPVAETLATEVREYASCACHTPVQDDPCQCVASPADEHVQELLEEPRFAQPNQPDQPDQLAQSGQAGQRARRGRGGRTQKADEPGEKTSRHARGVRPALQRQEGAATDGDTGVADDELGDDLVRVPFESLDVDKLTACALETACGLIFPILGDTPMSVSLAGGHVEIHVDCGDDSGLLIGREGQTLTSLQYLASRIVSRGMGAAVRVQFNVGDYRERQDARLRELAEMLAERVRNTGRSCSTRPMSSYHRRIIHLTLQDSPDVQTRSSGEGPLKRIIVQRKRSNGETKAE